MEIKLKNDLRFERLEHQKHEEINQLKLRFFTNISHELRTPLMLIKAPLEQLLNRNDLGPTVKKPLETIYSNAERLLRLISQLLEFRKQETGNLRLSVQPANLRQFIIEIFESFELLAKQRKIQFTYRIQDDVPKNIWIDCDQMEKVFYNLIYNSFKFTPDEGKISLEVCKCFFTPKNENQEIAGINFLVVDNGRGIPKEQQSLIFERFFQVNNHSDYHEIGTGIGLTLSKGLIELHKGEISIVSEPSDKTIFSVFLRDGYNHYEKEQLAQESITLKKDKNKFHRDLDNLTLKENLKPKEYKNLQLDLVKNKKLLVVEDNRELQHLLAEVLGEHFEVHTASNGREGLDQLKIIQPDIIISDIMMPTMDGIEMCKSIKNNIEFSHLPVILLTAKSSHIHQREGYESGADDYITKPFHLDLLTLKVNNLLKSRENLQLQFIQTPNLEPSKIKITPTDEILLKDAIKAIEENMERTDFTIQDLV